MTFKRKLIVIILGVVSALALCIGITGCSNSSGKTSTSYSYAGDVYTLTIIFEEDGVTKYLDIYEDYNTGNTLSYSSYTIKTGYDFLGYYTAEGVQYFDEHGNQCQYIIESDLVLYARFAVKSYTINYLYDEDGDGTYETTYYTQTVTYGSTFVSFITAPSKTGYDFVGWAASATGSKYYSNGTTPNNTTFDEDNYTINSNDEVNMYARYKVKSMTVTLVYTNTIYSDITLTVDYGDTLPDLSKYYIDTGDKVVTGWSLSQYGNTEMTSAITMDITLYSIWQEYKYINLVYSDSKTVQYQVFNDTAVSCVLPADPELPGYTFDGWYSSAAYSGNPVTSAPYALLADTYYAKWTMATYLITFVYAEESFDDIYYTIESDTITLPEIVIDGYNFYGWCTDEALTSTPIKEIVPGTGAGCYGNFTLYPKIEKYSTTVTYYVGSSKAGSVVLEYGESYSIPIPTNRFGNDKVFNFWYMTDDNGDAVKLTDVNGNSLTVWTYTGTTLKVFADYDQLYSVTLSYTDPTTSSSKTVTYGYYRVGETVTITAPEIDNYSVDGYYISSTLVSNSDSYEYTVTESNVTITVTYTYKVVSSFSEKGFPYNVYYYNGHYYALVKLSKSWSAAESWCEFYGGHLVTITTSAEQTWLATLMAYVDPGVYNYHIGGYYSDGAWHWVSGETFSYTNWHSGEPNSSSENYIGFYSSYTDYTWNDGSGGSSYYVIEWDSLSDYTAASRYTLTDINGSSITLTLYKYNNHYYSVVDSSMLWTTAETYAEYLGGYLAVITNSAENSFVGSLLTYTSAGSKVYWLGGTDYDNEGTWVWVTGESFSYSNWNSGEPNDGNSSSTTQDYMTIAYSGYGWDDDYNTYSYPFVIEWNSLDDVGTLKALYSIKTISTASDFMSIQDNTSGYYILTNDITLTGEWTPVDFSGYLIGNGHTVSGITVNQSSGNAGVFLNVTGTIKNITFEVSVSSSSSDTVYVGGVVAYLNGGTLTDVTVKGTVTSSSITAYTGGMVGYMSSGTVSGLTNYATVNGSATGTGCTAGIIAHTDSDNFSNLVNYGDVTGYYDVGGVIGGYVPASSATITNLINYGTVTSVSSGTGSTGGVIGVIYRSFNNSTSYTFTLDVAENYGDVSATHSVGGVIGYLYLGNSGSGAYVFTGKNLYNEGDVISTGYNIGGLVGYGYAKTTTSYLSGTSSATVSGTYYVGGIAGYLQNVSLTDCSNAGSSITATGYTNDGTGDCVGLGGYVGYGHDITISNCSNAVAITYIGGTYKYVGGIAGHLRGSINNCSNTATISSTGNEVGGVVGTFAISGTTSVSGIKNSGAVSGTYYVGGVFGEIWWDNSTAANITLTISEITNSGDVTASSHTAGGIVGYIYLNNSNNSYTITLYASGFVNTGDVTGAFQVGGLVGYGYTESNASYITSSANSGAVTGTYYVGGLAGYLSNISLTDSFNEGATVTATGYLTSSGVNYAYVGGYVGYGYAVSGLTNEVAITYDYSAYYVGGVAGYLTGTAASCTNNAVITASKALRIGGIVGGIEGITSGTYSGLTNTAAITGSSQTGGVIGYLYRDGSNSSNYTVYFTTLTNSGDITSGDFTGGNIGYLYLVNTKSGYNYVTDFTALVNTGSVTGASYTGGLAGYAHTTSTTSYMTSCSNSGSVTGTYYLGGFAGYLGNITLKDSTNEGAAITSTNYLLDTANYAYVGGYVGSGYAVSGLTNTVSITYTYSAWYVGGVAGYLSSTATSCSNSGNITASKAYGVGGIVGGIKGITSGTYSGLTNSGDIAGYEYTGGIIGYLYRSESNSSNYTVYFSTLTNSGTVTGGSYTGGMIGYMHLANTKSGYSFAVYMSALANSGAVSGGSYTGGLVGYGYTTNSASYIADSSNSASVAGTYYLGGMAGYLYCLGIKDSSNEGTTITSTDYLIGDWTCAYVGGYAGYAYLSNMTNLTNNVAITYTLNAAYVGGIAGWIYGTLTDCTNNADITSSGQCAGGIAGEIGGLYSATLSGLTNTGAISGTTKIGGIVGSFYTSVTSSTNYTLYFKTVKNSGNVTATGDYAGGIIGYFYLDNTKSGYAITAIAAIIENTGTITAENYCCGIFGYGYTDGSSTVSDYISTGTITCEGTYYGTTYTGSNITFSE